MPSDIPHSAFPAARPSVCALLTSFSVVCFIGTLASDLVYVRSTQMMWTNFSAWLLTVGVVVGWLALIAGIIEYFAERHSPRYEPPAVAYVIGAVIALVLATINMFIHTHDAWTSVMPWGLVFSIAVVVVLLVTGWLRTRKSWERMS
jgi:uncharacterized membrane protein